MLQPIVTRTEKKGIGERVDKKTERKTRTYVTRTLQFKILFGTATVEKWFQQQSTPTALETLRGLYQSVV